MVVWYRLWAGCILYGGFLTKATGIVIEGVPFLLMGELYAAIAAILLILVAKFILKVNPNGFVLTEEMRAEYKNYKNSRTQLIGLVATAVFFVCLLLPSVFHSPIWAMFGQWGIVGWSIIYIVFFNILKGEDGEPVCTVETALIMVRFGSYITVHGYNSAGRCNGKRRDWHYCNRV